MEFDRVFWPIFRNRTVFYDELVLRENRKNPDPLLLNLPSYIAKRCESVERLYRQLKGNYEEKKDYKRIGDFHYGEMEIHRMGSPWRRRFPFSWYNLYWALNGYGEHPLRALNLVWRFSLCLHRPHLVPGADDHRLRSTRRFLAVLPLCPGKATLPRPTWGSPFPGWGEFVASLSALFLLGQAAFFFLALRNCLGRRR